MSYVARRFLVSTGSGGGGTIAADQINQFLMLNPGISPISLTISWRFGRSRSDQYYLTLVYRGGSVPVRSWCIQFQSTATLTAEAQATTFFANNPTYAPICTQVVTRPGSVTTSRRLLVIYGTFGYLQPQCIRQAVSAAPATSLAVGAIGSMYDTLDLTRPAIPVMNLGNVAWPAGGANLAVTRVGNNPDLCAFGGIAPGCYTGGGVSPPAPLLPTLLCGHCFPPDVPTVTTTSTTSTSTTSTSTTSTTSTSTSTTTFTGTTTTTTSTSTSTTTFTGTTTTTTSTSTSTTTFTFTTSSTTTTTNTTTTSTLTTAPVATCSACGFATQPSFAITSGNLCDPSKPVTGSYSFQGSVGGPGVCDFSWTIPEAQGGGAIVITYEVNNNDFVWGGTGLIGRLYGVGGGGPAPGISCSNGIITGTVIAQPIYGCPGPPLVMIFGGG